MAAVGGDDVGDAIAAGQELQPHQDVAIASAEARLPDIDVAAPVG